MDEVPICYFDRSKHIHRTECVDPYKDIPRIMADDEDDYSCGCCSPDIEISGSLTDYCFATGDAAEFRGRLCARDRAFGNQYHYPSCVR
jgi:hypothetical protein